MPVSKPTRLGMWLDAVRAWIPTARQQTTDWVAACREQPALIWQTAGIRYAVYLAGGMLMAGTVIGLLSFFEPANAQPRARTTDFHVLCTNSECGRHFVIQRKFRFNDFPVDCSFCRTPNGRHALRCFSDACGGRWRATQRVEKSNQCAVCSAILD